MIMKQAMFNSLFASFLFFSCVYVHPSLALMNRTTLLFNEGFNKLYGANNVVPYDANRSVEIIMDYAFPYGSGFKSKLQYVNGKFEALIKLPGNYSAGVVPTFYMSNGEKFTDNHDEIDFEFLGHINGQPWILQTNMYGDGSTNRGREEKYVLWFDPSEGFHRYGILWNKKRITYYVDDIPIRHVKRIDAMGSDFPTKEMNLYATIWNGSDWATNGGRDKLDLSYGPYIVKYTDFEVSGCVFNSCDEGLVEHSNGELTLHETRVMNIFRRKHMIYSYCYDRKRYVVPLPECM